jgi:hypothetical protein
VNTTSANAVITQLVQERSHSAAAMNSAQFTAPKVERKQRSWSRLAKEPIYLLKLTVKVGPQSLKLDGSHLGIADNVLQLLERAARGGYAAKISHRLRDAANKLQARQKIIYNRYTVSSEPFRMVHESALPKAMEAIEEMLAEADVLRTEMLEAYEVEYTAFLEWVCQVLAAAAIEPDEVETALRQYADAYPSKEELQTNSLHVVVEGPIKIPSLLERSQQEAELAQQQAAREATEVERQKLKLLQRSQETLQQTLLSTLYDAQVRSFEEANAKLAQLLESFNLEGVDATSRTGQKWETLISRLQVLAQYDSNLKPIIEKAEQLGQLYLTDSLNLEAVQNLLEDFRAMLKDRVQQQDSTGAGIANLTKALALDAGYSELLGQLDEIALCPDPEQLRQIKGKLAAMESLFKFRSKDLKKRWEVAENAVRQSLGIKEISQPKVTQSSEESTAKTEILYDPEAGF